jgi:regulator of replication initiation timing
MSKIDSFDLPENLADFVEWEAQHLEMSDEEIEERLASCPEQEEIREEEQQRRDTEAEEWNRYWEAFGKAFRKRYGVDFETYQLRQSAEYIKSLRQAMGMDRFMTVEELADFLRIAAKTVRNRLSENSFPIRHIERGWKVLFYWSDVLIFIMGIQGE